MPCPHQLGVDVSAFDPDPPNRPAVPVRFGGHHAGRTPECHCRKGLACSVAPGLPALWRVDLAKPHADLIVSVHQQGQGVAILDADHSAA
jgi:hypothetical protein